MPNSRRDRRARKRYARSLRDILAVRNDARGIAVHLRESLPMATPEELRWDTGYATHISACADIRDSVLDIPVTPYDELAAAAAKLGGQLFWYVSPGYDLKDRRHFAVFVVEDVTRDQPAHEVTLEVPAFIASPTSSTSPVTLVTPVTPMPPVTPAPPAPSGLSDGPADEPDSDDEPEVEVDCHE